MIRSSVRAARHDRRLVLAAIGFAAACAALPASAFDIGWGGNTLVGSGKQATETRAASDFQAVALRGSIDVVIRQSGHEGVQIQGDDNLLPIVEANVEAGHGGRTLVIGTKRGQSFRTKLPLVVTVDVVNLKSVSLAGSGDLRIESLKTPALDLGISGSSDARIDSLQADELHVSLSGSGDVQGAGHAGKLKLSIAGSGDARLAGLQADEVSVSIAGSGDADVRAEKSLAVSIAGSGDVVYHGNGTLSHSSIAGSGSVVHKP